jgi:hypothetical protein
MSTVIDRRYNGKKSTVADRRYMRRGLLARVQPSSAKPGNHRQDGEGDIPKRVHGRSV